MSTQSITIIEADFENPDHRDAAVRLIDAYSRDPMAAGEALKPHVYAELGEALRAFPTKTVFLALSGESPVGVCVCFLGFSTFYARPLLNVHDLGVLEECRGKGVGAALLDAAEEKARELGCCKLTLEVFDNNPARRLYERSGYRQYVLGTGEAGKALFYSKTL